MVLIILAVCYIELVDFLKHGLLNKTLLHEIDRTGSAEAPVTARHSSEGVNSDMYFLLLKEFLRLNTTYPPGAATFPVSRGGNASIIEHNNKHYNVNGMTANHS